MPVVAALINNALESGTIYAAKTADGVSLMVKVFGVGVQIGHIPEAEVNAMMRPKLVPVQ